jgi:tetratricopeptide (TPR) repeat protein
MDGTTVNRSQPIGVFVEKASFTGTYRIKEADCFPELHADEFSGLCYAWRQENGISIVLPLSRGNTPHGSCYLVDDNEFIFLFSPLDSATAPDNLVPRYPLCSNAPDLIGMWYEQSLASPASSALSGDEAHLTPAWHPDNIFLDPKDKAASGAVHASEPHTAQPLPPASRSTMAKETASASAATAHAKEEREDPESRSARLEQRMRGKFEALLQAMDEAVDTQLEEEMARLLTLGSSFDWRQKFMFTEFGLALRRKQKFTLALSSHLRALELAPNDERILFNVARAEYELRNPDKARYYLDKALSVAPDFTVARNFQSFLLGRA